MVKNNPTNAGDAGLIPGLRRFPGVGNGSPPIILPGESHGQRSLAGCSPDCLKGSDMTEGTCIHL